MGELESGESAESHYPLAPVVLLWATAQTAGAPDWLAGGDGVPPGEKAAEAELDALLAPLWYQSAEREVRDDAGATRLVWGQVITVYSFSIPWKSRVLA